MDHSDQIRQSIFHVYGVAFKKGVIQIEETAQNTHIINLTHNTISLLTNHTLASQWIWPQWGSRSSQWTWNSPQPLGDLGSPSRDRPHPWGASTAPRHWGTPCKTGTWSCTWTSALFQAPSTAPSWPTWADWDLASLWRHHQWAFQIFVPWESPMWWRRTLPLGPCGASLRCCRRRWEKGCWDPIQAGWSQQGLLLSVLPPPWPL